MPSRLWINNVPEKIFLQATNSPTGRPKMLSSHKINSSVWTAWCIPEGNSGCAWVSVAHPSWSCQAAEMHQTEKLEKKAHHRLNQKQCADTHTLTSSVSICHPSACSPARPSPSATAAGSVLRCFGTLLAGIQLRPAGKTERRGGGGGGDTPLKQN